MADQLEKVYGRVVSMTRVAEGATLTAAAGIADTVLQVSSIEDFNEDGGQVVIIAGETETVYDYDSIDEDTDTLTLTTGLLAPAEADDRVDVFDPETLGRVVEYEAQVLLDEQDPGDEPITVTVQHGLVNMLAESVRGGAAEAVTLVRDGDDDWMIWQIDGKLAVDVALEDAKADIGVSLQDLYDRADENAAAAAEAAANGTAALTAANGKNKVIYSASGPGATPNTAGDIWFQRSGGLIAGQWEGQGGTSWASVKLRGEVIAYLDAGQLTAGSAFVNGLSVKTNFTLGDAGTNGVIQSYNFAGSPVGVYIDKNGLVAKGGSIAGATLTSVTATASSFTTSGSYPITLASGVLDFSGGRSIYGNSLGFWLEGMGSAIGFSGSDVRVNCNGVPFRINGSGGSPLRAEVDTTGRVHAAAGFKHINTPPSSGGTANCYIDSEGLVTKSTSSERYKYDIEDATLDGEAVYNLQSRTFCRYDDPTGGRFTGLIAEEVEALGLGTAVVRDAEGRPDGIDWWVLTLHVIEALKGERAQRRADNADLRAELAELRAIVLGEGT